jgi:preprotein translocase subunit SecD
VHVNRYIEKASQDFGYNGHPSIKFKLNAIGANRFAKLTRNNTGRPIPIIVNGKVISAPNVASEVEDGNVEISGAFTIAEAQDIANAISSGTLPLKLQLVRSN